MRVRIVLVEPREAGNVGAAARAMKNFGFTDLCIVGPPIQRTDLVSDWWAKGADDLVTNARRTATLAEALGDCHLSVATSAVRERTVLEQLHPHEVADLAYESLSDEQTLAVVFGRERNGLTAEEIALCQRTAVIPTWPEFPTMNLAQAVAIFCYELGRGLRPAQEPRDFATIELLQHLNAEVRRLFDEKDAFGDKDPARICAELLALEGRAGLTTREASLLLGLVRRVRR